MFPQKVQLSVVGRHQKLSRPFIHSSTGLLLFTAPDLWLLLSLYDPPPYPCLVPEKVKEESVTVLSLLSVGGESQPNKSFQWCRGGCAWGLAYMWGVHLPSTWNNIHTHSHNRGPYILLPFLCVSDKSRHTHFTDTILRRSSMVGRLPVSKLNFITGRRAWQTRIYKLVVKDEGQSGWKYAFVFAGLTGAFMDGRTIFLPQPSVSFR